MPRPAFEFFFFERRIVLAGEATLVNAKHSQQRGIKARRLIEYQIRACDDGL